VTRLLILKRLFFGLSDFRYHCAAFAGMFVGLIHFIALMFAVIMGTELLRVTLNEEDLDFPEVPPGFESFTSFKLKVESAENEPTCSVSSSISHQESVHVKSEPSHGGAGKISRSLRRRSGINYGRFSICSDEDSDSEQLCQVVLSLLMGRSLDNHHDVVDCKCSFGSNHFFIYLCRSFQQSLLCQKGLFVGVLNVRTAKRSDFQVVSGPSHLL